MRDTAATCHDMPHAPISFPVVGIGASAGGLEAFTRLLQGLATDTGMAFVFVQHLAAEHQSLLTLLLVTRHCDGCP